MKNQRHRVNPSPDFGISDALFARQGMRQILVLLGVRGNDLRQEGKRMQRRTLLCQEQQQSQQGMEKYAPIYYFTMAGKSFGCQPTQDFFFARGC